MPNERLSEHIWRVGGGDITSGRDAAAYLVGGGNRFMLVDCGTGFGSDLLERNIGEICPDLKKIRILLLTHAHADHIGGVPEVQRASGCRLAAHEGDRAAIENGDPDYSAASWYQMELQPMAVDITLAGEGGELPVGEVTVQWLHTPGHTPGSIVAVVDEPDGTRVLLGQDLHGPFHEDFQSDQTAWRRSMAAVIGLQADVLGEGHYGVFRGRDTVRAFIEDLLERL